MDFIIKCLIILTFTQVFAYEFIPKRPNYGSWISPKKFLKFLNALPYYYRDPNLRATKEQHMNSRNLNDLLFTLLTKKTGIALRKKLSRMTNGEILETLSKVYGHRAHRTILRNYKHQESHFPSDWSGEHNDALNPEEYHSSDSSSNEAPITTHRPVSKYKWYDFWTYKKPYIPPIFECPADMVRVDGICVQTPPH